MDSKVKKIYNKEALAKTTKLLEFNPEFYTVWNYRRRIFNALFLQEELDRKKTLEGDLQLVLAQLKRYPKCYWIWNHRTWCLQQLSQTGEANWDFEFRIVSKLLESDPRNFHGWQYRRFVVENIKQSNKAKSPQQDPLIIDLKVDFEEFQYTSKKINNNISNFSAWHNRTKLLPQIYYYVQNIGCYEVYIEGLEMFRSPDLILNHELSLIKTGIYMDAEDSSVWLYLRWLLTDDLFVEFLRLQNLNAYKKILEDQFALISELNELEILDHDQGWDNVWCLKTMILIKGLLKREDLPTVDDKELIDDDIKRMLQKLVLYDEPRHRKYEEQIKGTIPLID